MKIIVGLILALLAYVIFLIPRTITVTVESTPRPDPIVEVIEVVEPEVNIADAVRLFLEEKKSPLAEETEFLLTQRHWRLLIAISAIESEYCKRQIAHNCFGLGGESAYRYYSSVRASIVDANDLIEFWQQKGKWLTPETMNCSYVVPCSENWVRVVTEVLKKLPQ